VAAVEPPARTLVLAAPINAQPTEVEAFSVGSFAAVPNLFQGLLFCLSVSFFSSRVPRECVRGELSKATIFRRLRSLLVMISSIVPTVTGNAFCITLSVFRLSWQGSTERVL
jgi:hypothetical protein